MKRFVDFFFSLAGLIFISPVLLFISALIAVDSRGGVFYRQVRVGRKNVDFKLLKFRTMKTGSDKKGLLTIGNSDDRITRVGYYLRKYKLDELPQLFNVLSGDMSLVGPRPEVRKYVDFYSEEQMRVLDVKPGITDFASLKYIDENEILKKAENPEKMYIEEIMPNKLRINLDYVANRSVLMDLSIMFRTVFKIISSGR